jgi:hypothetical protein
MRRTAWHRPAALRVLSSEVRHLWLRTMRLLGDATAATNIELANCLVGGPADSEATTGLPAAPTCCKR